jgi:N-acyl-D-amino-acid deacylase
MPYDLVIKNGKVIDGSGLPGFYADVATSGGSIVEVGKVTGEARGSEPDGLAVAPGIIDTHATGALPVGLISVGNPLKEE